MSPESEWLCNTLKHPPDSAGLSCPVSLTSENSSSLSKLSLPFRKWTSCANITHFPTATTALKQGVPFIRGDLLKVLRNRWREVTEDRCHCGRNRESKWERERKKRADCMTSACFRWSNFSEALLFLFHHMTSSLSPTHSSIYTQSVQNISNTFLIVSFTPFCTQNSLNSLGHGLHKVLKAFHRDASPCWLQWFSQLCQVGWMSFGWWTILDTHGKLLRVKNPAELQFLTHSNRCAWHLLQYRKLFIGTYILAHMHV